MCPVMKTLKSNAIVTGTSHGAPAMHSASSLLWRCARDLCVLLRYNWANMLNKTHHCRPLVCLCFRRAGRAAAVPNSSDQKRLEPLDMTLSKLHALSTHPWRSALLLTCTVRWSSAAPSSSPWLRICQRLPSNSPHNCKKRSV